MTRQQIDKSAGECSKSCWPVRQLAASVESLVLLFPFPALDSTYTMTPSKLLWVVAWKCNASHTHTASLLQDTRWYSWSELLFKLAAEIA